MIGILPGWSLLGGVHDAAICATNAAGQITCADTAGSSGLFAGIGILFLFIYVAVAVVGIVAAVKIVSKAGYSGWWVLLAIVPFLGTVLLLIFAFSEWPVVREVKMLRAQAAGAGGYGGPGAYGRGYVPGGGPVPAAPAAAVPWTGSGPGGPAEAKPAGQTEHTVDQVVIPSFGQVMRDETLTPQAAGTRPATEPSAAPSAQPAAGWFPAPGGSPGQRRYWDGSAWTDHYA